MSNLKNNIGTKLKISGRYADCVATIDLGNFKAKNEFDRRNLEAMYDKGFVNFNFIYNCEDP